MKILSISPYLPSETTGHAGAQTISRNLTYLASTNQISLACFVNEEDVIKVDQLNDYNIDVHYVILNRNSKTSRLKLFLSRFIPILRTLAFWEPYYISKYYNFKMIKLVKKIRDKWDPDLIHIEYNIMYHYAKYFPGKPKILTEHDVTTVLKHRIFMKSRSKFSTIKNLIDYHLWNRIEPKILRKFDKISTVTVEDKQYTKKWKHIPQIQVIPPPIFVNLPNEIVKEKNCLTFIGSFNRKPNIQAVEELLYVLIPIISKIRANTVLKIAGKHLPVELQNKINSMDNVEYYGFVEDIDSFIAKSILFLSPIRIGAGLKMKITHALACGTPVLTTSIGAEGIEISEEEGLFVEDDKQKICAKCIFLMSDMSKLNKIGKLGQNRVNKLYSISAIANKWMDQYQELQLK